MRRVPQRFNALLTILLLLAAGTRLFAQDETTLRQPAVFGEIIEVRVVNLEVVVTDRDGNRVTGLEPGSFSLFVDGIEVPIEFFSEVRSGVAMEANGVPAGMELAPGTEIGEPVGTSYLIFIDDFFTIARDRNLVLDEISQQITTLGPADRAAIVAFNGRDLDMLSSWTQSTDEIQSILEAAKDRPSRGLQRLSERSRFDDSDQLAAVSAQLRQEARQADFALDTYLGPEERFYATMLSGQVQRGVQGATATLRSFARPPGRKVMLLAMGSWPFLPAEFVVSDLRRPVLDTRITGGGELFRPLTETANRLGYTLYPIDVPGFDRTAGDITANLSDPSTGFPGNRTGADSSFIREQEAHYTLNFLAEETGGKAFINSGRLEAFEQTQSDTRSYYWLGFTPQWNGDDSYHDVEIRLTDPSLTVRSRNGFLDLSRVQETSMEVESALLFGSPPSEDPLALQFGRPEKGGFRKMNVPLRIDIPLDKVTFLPTSDGGQQASLEVRVAVIDKTGAQAEIPVIPLMINLPVMPPEGQLFTYDLDLKMRRERHRAVVAIYDQASGSMLSGTAEISP